MHVSFALPACSYIRMCETCMYIRTVYFYVFIFLYPCPYEHQDLHMCPYVRIFVCVPMNTYTLIFLPVCTYILYTYLSVRTYILYTYIYLYAYTFCLHTSTCTHIYSVNIRLSISTHVLYTCLPTLFKGL